jgi:ribose transport system ATP-binding protein
VSGPGTSSNGTILQALGIVKRFPGSLALDHVDFELRMGEVHVLVGENGAGKSTLIKILSGVIQADEGELLFRDQPIRLIDPHEAHRRGIATIYQDINLAQDLSVTDNLLLGREVVRFPLPILDRHSERSAAAQVLDRVDSAIHPDAIVGELSLADQQIVAIAKALSRQAQVLILDEPTALLSASDIDRVFTVLRDLKASGMSILYVSHRLNEAISIGDRVTALRDGRKIATRSMLDVKVAELVGLVAGRDLTELHQEPAAPSEEVTMQVAGLSRLPELADISFSVRSREILGITGTVGSGKEILARALFGDLQLDAGKITISGRTLNLKSPRHAIRAGIGLVPSDRKNDGLLLVRNMAENVTVASLARYCWGAMLRFRARREAAYRYVKLLHVRGPGFGAPVRNFSGGNQQKIVLAKWLDTNARVLVLVEPTNGLDVGAKADVYSLVHRLASEGAAVVVISSELPEVLGIAHRVLVMRGGRIVGEYARGAITERNLLEVAIGGTDR